MRRNVTRGFRAGLAILAVAAGLGLGRPAAAQDATDPTLTHVRFRYRSVGLVPGQTIRLSAASLRAGTPPPQPDRVRFVLFDADGHRIADSGERTIADNATTVVFDVAHGDLGLKGEPDTGRVQFRAVVTFSNPNGYPPGPCRPNLEILNTATGRTTFGLSDPEPDRF